MAFSLTVSQSIGDTRKIQSSNSYSASSVTELEETVANSATDYEIVCAIDVSEVAAFGIVSDRNVTIETNDGSSPDDTIALIAGVPYIWTSDSYDSFLLTADVTSFFATNSSGGSATIQIKVNQDATP